MRLICIGDSLTFGYGVHLSQRWTQLCAQETGWELVNEGINGDTTGGMLARMQGGVLAELREGGLGADRPYVLLMGGSNDVFYSGSDAAARGNMGAMIHQLFSVGVLPMVGIPLPADAPHAPRAWAAAVDFEAAERTMKVLRMAQAVLHGVWRAVYRLLRGFSVARRIDPLRAAARRSAPDAGGTPLDGAAAERAAEKTRITALKKA